MYTYYFRHVQLPTITKIAVWQAFRASIPEVGQLANVAPKGKSSSNYLTFSGLGNKEEAIYMYIHVRIEFNYTLNI